MDRSISRSRRVPLVVAFGIASAMGLASAQAQQLCGGVDYPFPYNDVSGVGAAFCPGIMEAYVTGVSKGTSPNTFSPNNTVTRVQMTTFLQRSLDQGLARTSRRAALKQWWTSQSVTAMQTIATGGTPLLCAADGAAIWMSITGASLLVEVQANTGTILGTWTGATGGADVLPAAGKVFVTGNSVPGSLYFIDPTQPPTAVTLAANNVGNNTTGIAFDGTHLWTANQGSPGSVSIITPQASTPYPVNTIATGFNTPAGILYDGSNIWVTDFTANKLFKLDGLGAIVQTVTVGTTPGFPVFDGANIWVPNQTSNSISVVQASTGTVVATINSDVNNHLSAPTVAAFDGERILITNLTNDTVTVFKAADLSFIANVITGPSAQPNAACSDGVNFWVGVGTGNLLRF